jgi:hypothetical protein
MKNLIPIALFFLTVFTSCTKNATGVRVRFVNHTGAPIETATAEGKMIGSIGTGSSTGYIHFDRFGTDTGMPDIRFQGKLNGTVLESSSVFFWCGTEKSQLEPGKYSISVKTVQFNNETFFQLRFE